jgi:hydroxymethylpyrimidine pyrophosphatase-like HAD family hydrolase
MPQDFYFEKCSAHPNQLIKFYCSDCIKEACKECKDNEHVNCSDINHLPTLASDIQKSEEFKNLRKDMDHLLEDIKYSEKLLKAKSEVIDKQEERATEKFKEHTENLISSYKHNIKISLKTLKRKWMKPLLR